MTVSFLGSTLALLIVSLFIASFLWAKLFIDNFKVKNKQAVHYRSMLTASGLFISKQALIVACFFRLSQIRGWMNLPHANNYIAICLIVMFIGNFILILAATSANKTLQIKSVIAIFICWVIVLFTLVI